VEVVVELQGRIWRHGFDSIRPEFQLFGLCLDDFGVLILAFDFGVDVSEKAAFFVQHRFVY